MGVILLTCFLKIPLKKKFLKFKSVFFVSFVFAVRTDRLANLKKPGSCRRDGSNALMKQGIRQVGHAS